MSKDERIIFSLKPQAFLILELETWKLSLISLNHPCLINELFPFFENGLTCLIDTYHLLQALQYLLLEYSVIS